uniref:Uncharacterized protein n=1 Tax=Escherichia coli TaxID=562 RepID=C6G9S3_ECOLX|nr:MULTISPECIES: hypothetical protein [Gammaproteobacteria]ACN66853.1 hypothetical protein pRAx_0036 [Escherichia coli]
MAADIIKAINFLFFIFLDSLFNIKQQFFLRSISFPVTLELEKWMLRVKPFKFVDADVEFFHSRASAFRQETYLDSLYS